MPGKHEAEQSSLFLIYRICWQKCILTDKDVKAGSLEHLEDVDPNAMMYVLTNLNQVNGAVYMCDEEVMSLIAEKLGIRFNRDSTIIDS